MAAKAKAPKRMRTRPVSQTISSEYDLTSGSNWLQKTAVLYVEVHNWGDAVRKDGHVKERPAYAPWTVANLAAIIIRELPKVAAVLQPHMYGFADAARTGEGTITVGSYPYGSAHKATLRELWKFAQIVWRMADPRGHAAAAAKTIVASGGTQTAPIDVSDFDLSKVQENWQDVNPQLSANLIAPDGAKLEARMVQELAAVLKSQPVPHINGNRRMKPTAHRATTTDRDVTFVHEFDRGEFPTIAAFAQSKGMDRPAMSLALRRGREAIAAQQVPKRKSSHRK